MPVTTLDPKTALILIDLQKGVVGLPTVHPTGEVVARAARLAEAHANSIEMIFPCLGETGMTEAILALIDARA